MIVTRSFMGQFWTDLNSPTKEEVDSLVLTQNLSPIIAKDLLTPTPFQHAKSNGSVLYAVLHIPAFKHSHSVSENSSQEIDFIISENGLLTARYDSIDAMHYFAKQIEVNEILNKGENLHIFFRMIKEIYKGMADELSYIEDWTEQIEKNIFNGYEKEMVYALSNAGRNLLNFKKISEPHGNIFEFLKSAGSERFGNEFESEMSRLIEDWKHIIRRVNGQIEMINELRETNNSMLSTKQNEIMKVFTIMAFVTFPLSLIATIFSMRTWLPFLGWKYDFFAVIGMMILLSLVMFSYFKYKKWI